MSVLDDIVAKLGAKDALAAAERSLRNGALGLGLAFSAAMPFSAYASSAYAPREAAPAPLALSPAYTGTIAPSYSINPHQGYALDSDKLYVHVPSWVTIERRPLHLENPGLYGLAYIRDGRVIIDSALEGDAYDEVLDHEIGHLVNPYLTENQNRANVRAKFGDRARVHHKLGHANY